MGVSKEFWAACSLGFLICVFPFLLASILTTAQSNVNKRAGEGDLFDCLVTKNSGVRNAEYNVFRVHYTQGETSVQSQKLVNGVDGLVPGDFKVGSFVDCWGTEGGRIVVWQQTRLGSDAVLMWVFFSLFFLPWAGMSVLFAIK